MRVQLNRSWLPAIWKRHYFCDESTLVSKPSETSRVVQEKNHAEIDSVVTGYESMDCSASLSDSYSDRLQER